MGLLSRLRNEIVDVIPDLQNPFHGVLENAYRTMDSSGLPLSPSLECSSDSSKASPFDCFACAMAL